VHRAVTLSPSLISVALGTIRAIGRNTRQATEIRREQLHLRSRLAGESVNFVHFRKGRIRENTVRTANRMMESIDGAPLTYKDNPLNQC